MIISKRYLIVKNQSLRDALQFKNWRIYRNFEPNWFYTTVGLLGKGGGKALSLVKEAIVINSNTTARIQEMHITIGHILCDLIEEGLHLKA